MDSLNSVHSKHLNVGLDTKQSLLDERFKLLESIDRLQRIENPNLPTICELKIEFNRVVSRLDRFRSSSGVDPLAVLPPELWEDIIYDGSTILTPKMQSTGEIARISVDNLLSYTMVSRRWQQAIMSTPKLWAHLYVGDELHDMAIKVNLGLHFSRELPLTLYLGDQLEESWKVVGPMISTQSFRLQSIKLLDDGCSLNDQLSYVLTLQDLSSLRSLDSRRYRDNPSLGEDKLGILLQKVKSLHSLEEIVLSKEIMELDSLQQLRTLMTKEPPDRLLPLKHLTHVSLRYDEQGDISDSNFGTLPSNTGAVEPLQWQSLYVHAFMPVPFLESLFSRTASTLVSLDTEIPWSRLASLLITCSSMPFLRRLFLLIDKARDLGHKVILPVSSTSTVRDFTIAIMSWRGELHSDSPNRFTENVATFFTFLTTWTPNLKLLQVSAPMQHETVSYIESLKGLSRLRISLDTNPHPPSAQQTEQVTQLIDFKSDEVDFTGFSDHFQQYSSLEALKLIVLFTASPSYNAILPPIRNIINPSLWINIRSLEISTWLSDWTGVSFPHVRIIILGNRHSSPSVPTSISSLCKELVLGNTKFPSLETLESQLIPEWDILMLMLERRNCYADPNVTRITSLSFSTIPPPSILGPLTQLLRGELPVYESLQEFSLHGISNVYFDPSVPGCIRCHLFCHACSTPQVTGYRDIEQVYTPKTLTQSLEYPMSTDEILATHKQRLQAWLDLFNHSTKHFPIRRNQCSRHKLKPLCEITGHTLNGSCIDTLTYTSSARVSCTEEKNAILDNEDKEYQAYGEDLTTK